MEQLPNLLPLPKRRTLPHFLFCNLNVDIWFYTIAHKLKPMNSSFLPDCRLMKNYIVCFWPRLLRIFIKLWNLVPREHMSLYPIFCYTRKADNSSWTAIPIYCQWYSWNVKEKIILYKLSLNFLQKFKIHAVTYSSRGWHCIT